VGAQGLEPDTAFEVVEGIRYRERSRREDHGFLVGERSRLELPPGRGRGRLDERAGRYVARFRPSRGGPSAAPTRPPRSGRRALELGYKKVEFAFRIGVALEWQLGRGVIEGTSKSPALIGDSVRQCESPTMSGAARPTASRMTGSSRDGRMGISGCRSFTIAARLTEEIVHRPAFGIRSRRAYRSPGQPRHGTR